MDRQKEELEESLEKIRQQNQLYEAIVSSTPDLVYVMDTDYRFIFANDALLELMGCTKDELLGKSLQEVSENPAHPERYEQEINEVIDSKKMVQGEDAFRHDKLGRRYYHYIFMPIYDGQGAVKAVAGTTRDITGHKQAEQALKKNEERYRTLVENFPGGAVGLFDENLRYTAVGGELVNSLSVNPEDRIGKKVSDIYPDELVEVVEPYFQAALDGEANSFEADLHGRHLFAQTLPIKDDTGQVYSGMLVVQDVSERWQAQRALRKSEEKYRTLFEKMDEGFGIIQMLFDEHDEPVNFKFLETNPAYQKHAGLSISEGDTAKEVLPNFGEEMLYRNGQVALTGESYHREVYVEELGRWLDLSAFRIGDPEERKVAILLQNITERKQVQEELKTMNQTLEERVKKRTQSLLSYQSQLRSLATQLSKTEEKERHRLATDLHDNLGQMLAVNKMKMEMMQQDKDQLPDNMAAALDEIKQGMDEAIAYTRDLMSDLKPPPSLDKEDVKATIEWLADKMKKHGLEVTVRDDGQPKQAKEEVRSTLLQSVREVLFNIVKHADVDEACIRMKCRDSWVHISVEDEGQGFDYQAQKLSSVEQGGFGLFNIQERMDLLGGRMEVASEPGKGTKVTLKAPLKKGETSSLPAEIGTPSNKEPAQDGHQEIKVMLVDDHQMIREGLKKIVNTEEDLTVVAEASDGRKAVEAARDITPDIIVMDVDMPHMNGIDATEHILSMMPEVRVIGLSLHNHRDVVESMRSAGASAYLSKDEAFETLCATIRSEASA